MDLRLPSAAPGRYRSRSQIARVTTEAWAARELYCLACSEDRLETLRANTAVHDFTCPACRSNYQLKSKAGPFGARVANSGYAKKIAAIEERRAPNYVFLSYDRGQHASVASAFAVPGRYFSASVIERRAPLGPLARRHGWVGSNILLGSIGTLGRVQLVADGEPVDGRIARSHWQRLRFVDDLSPNLRGWLNDTWSEIERIGSPEFSLGELYESEASLRKKHPGNQHVRAKLRQQVQLLRDKGFLTFVGGGRYRVRGGPWSPPRSPDL